MSWSKDAVQKSVDETPHEARVLLRLEAWDRAFKMAERADTRAVPALTDVSVIELALRIEAYALYGEQWKEHCE